MQISAKNLLFWDGTTGDASEARCFALRNSRTWRIIGILDFELVHGKTDWNWQGEQRFQVRPSVVSKVARTFVRPLLYSNLPFTRRYRTTHISSPTCKNVSTISVKFPCIMVDFCSISCAL